MREAVQNAKMSEHPYLKLVAPDRIYARCMSFRSGIEGCFGGISGQKIVSWNLFTLTVIVTPLAIPTEFRTATANFELISHGKFPVRSPENIGKIAIHMAEHLDTCFKSLETNFNVSKIFCLNMRSM